MDNSESRCQSTIIRNMCFPSKWSVFSAEARRSWSRSEAGFDEDYMFGLRQLRDLMRGQRESLSRMGMADSGTLLGGWIIWRNEKEEGNGGQRDIPVRRPRQNETMRRYMVFVCSVSDLLHLMQGLPLWSVLWQAVGYYSFYNYVYKLCPLNTGS